MNRDVDGFSFAIEKSDVGLMQLSHVSREVQNYEVGTKKPSHCGGF